MVEAASGLGAAEMALALDECASALAVASCEDMVRRRVLGEPLQYVLGRWGFRGLELLVDRRVLIPRPETEVVVEVARGELEVLREIHQAAARQAAARQAPARQAAARPAAAGPPALVAVDLGTGSGAIALALAAEEPGLDVWATDASADALAVARANLAGIGARSAARVQLVQGDWYEALPMGLEGQVDLIVSNPPYVSEPEEAELPVEVAGWEPHSALVAGPSGLESIRAVVGGALRWLRRPGGLVVEIAPDQVADAVALACTASFSHAEVRADLAGRPRVLVARVGGAGKWRVGGHGGVAHGAQFLRRPASYT